MGSYLDRAREGNHGWKTYLAGSILVLFIWQVVGAVFGIALAVLLRPSGTSAGEGIQALTEMSRSDPIRALLVLLITEIIGFAGLSLALRTFHRRSFISLITYRSAIEWRRVLLGFGTWLVVEGLSTLVDYAHSPSLYSIRIAPAAFIRFLPLALILIATQTSLEELIFRGYLMQGASLISRRTAFLVILSGLAFALPHIINPEAEHQILLAFLNFFLIGALLAWWSIRDGTLELAFGIHAANNVFGLLFVSYSHSVLETPSIFYYRGDPVGIQQLVWVVADILAFSFLVLALRMWARWRTSRHQGNISDVLAEPQQNHASDFER